MYSVRNVHGCMYTGVTSSPWGLYYLCDELGYLEVFSAQKEKVVACLHLVQSESERRTDKILNGHLDPGTYVFTFSFIDSFDYYLSCFE